MSLKIYNTASRTKEEFKPINPSEVSIYNCGLTVYDYAHIGNLRAYTMADTIRRGLEFLGYNVKQVQNFTDVGHMTLTDEQKAKQTQQTDINDEETGIDKMEKAAQKSGKSVEEIAQMYIDAAMKDFHAMNFEEPFERPRATKYIKEQIDLIKILLDKGFAYITETAIYFDTSKFPNYGKLTSQNLNDKKVGAREEVEIDPTKKNPHDFRLWQLDQPNHAQEWDFDYEGKNLRGFPGWHVECSAMIHAILGQPIDIHTGGVDHISVHHTNEIAQSEAAWDKPLANYWVHNEFLLVDGRKMSKSLGNFYTLKDIAQKGFEPMDLRYFYLTANFNTQQNFTIEALNAAKRARNNLKDFILMMLYAKDIKADELNIELIKNSSWVTKFTEAVEDNFNMPQALAVVWEIVNLKDGSLNEIQKLSLIKYFDEVLGLNLFYFEEIKESPELIAKIQRIIEERTQAKKSGDYEKADQLRMVAKSFGFELEDTPEGTKFKKI